MVDSTFRGPRLAEIYDPLDADRGDLDLYAALAGELHAPSVLDIGCGTGTFACLLVRRGITVTAVEPAPASLEVARRKPGAERVRWLAGDCSLASAGFVVQDIRDAPDRPARELVFIARLRQAPRPARPAT